MSQGRDIESVLTRLILVGRAGPSGEKITSATSQIAAIAAGLDPLRPRFFSFPRDGSKGLSKGVAVTVSLAVVAAILMAAARSFETLKKRTHFRSRRGRAAASLKSRRDAAPLPWCSISLSTAICSGLPVPRGPAHSFTAWQPNRIGTLMVLFRCFLPCRAFLFWRGCQRPHYAEVQAHYKTDDAAGTRMLSRVRYQKKRCGIDRTRQHLLNREAPDTELHPSALMAAMTTPEPHLTRT